MSELKPIISLWYGRSQDEGTYTAHMTVSGLSSESQAQVAVNHMRTQFAGEELVHQDGPRAQPAQAVPLHQILTDPENQPNQYGIEFLMHGPKFAFKVGAQQFTLDYEPTEPGEFEYMRDMLIHAFSTFTSGVKTAQAVPMTDEQITAISRQVAEGGPEDSIDRFVRAIERHHGIVGKEGGNVLE